MPATLDQALCSGFLKNSGEVLIFAVHSVCWIQRFGKKVHSVHTTISCRNVVIRSAFTLPQSLYMRFLRTHTIPIVSLLVIGVLGTSLAISGESLRNLPAGTVSSCNLPRDELIASQQQPDSCECCPQTAPEPGRREPATAADDSRSETTFGLRGTAQAVPVTSLTVPPSPVFSSCIHDLPRIALHVRSTVLRA